MAISAFIPHCVNKIRTCKKCFYKLCCFIRDNIIARLFFTMNNSRLFSYCLNHSLFFPWRFGNFSHIREMTFPKDCRDFYEFTIFISSAASMLLWSEFCFGFKVYQGTKLNVFRSRNTIYFVIIAMRKNTHFTNFHDTELCAKHKKHTWISSILLRSCL